MVTFNNPSFFLTAVIILALFLIFSFLLKRWQHRDAVSFGNQPVKRRNPVWVFLVVLAILSFAVADPWVKSNRDRNNRTINPFIIMDVSHSMRAIDGIGGKTRLESGFLAIESLMAAYPDGKFGLALYTDVTSLYPPSSDTTSIATLLREINRTYLVRGEGSSLLQAVSDTEKMLSELPNKVNTIIIISDGDIEDQKEIGEIVETIREVSVDVVIVGVGETKEVTIPVLDESGKIVGYHRYGKGGTLALTGLNAVALDGLAEKVDGYYLHLKDADDLTKLVRSKSLDRDYVAQESTDSLIWIPVIFSLLLMFLWFLVSYRK